MKILWGFEESIKGYILKTLFNIVEARLKKKKLSFDVCVVLWCSDWSINSQESKS